MIAFDTDVFTEILTGNSAAEDTRQGSPLRSRWSRRIVQYAASDGPLAVLARAVRTVRFRLGGDGHFC
jgi:hypothetical protein